MDFSLSGNFDFATIPSRNRPVNIRGELLKLPWVICRFSRRQPGWLDFRANSPIFHHRMLRGTCTEISNWKFGNGLPSTGSSKVLQRCRTSRMLASRRSGTKARAWHKDGYIAGVNATIELTCSLTSQSSYTLPIFCCDSQSHKLTLLQSNTIKVIWNPPFWLWS